MKITDLRLDRRVCAAAVAALALAAYANSLANGFAFDDMPIIFGNALLHHVVPLSDSLFRPYWPKNGLALGLFRPLTSLDFALQWVVGGGSPLAFHIVSVLLHALVCVLVFLLLDRVAGRRGALVGALVFAVHPVHTEAVANVVGQAELLSAAGMLAACLLWATRPAKRPGAGRIAAITAAYLFAVATKESAIVLPALLPLLDLAERRHRSWAEAFRALPTYLRVWLPMTAAAAAYLGWRYAVLGSLTGLDVAPSLHFLREHHTLVGLRAWPEYLRLLFFPRDLAMDYEPANFPMVVSVTPMVVVGALLLAATVALALLLPRRPRLAFPAAWFLVTILVVSNLFFGVGVMLAERTLYLPSVAIAAVVAFAWDAAERSEIVRPALRFAVLALCLGLMTARTVIRNPDWKDTATALDALVRDHPENNLAQFTVASAMWGAGRLEESERYWRMGFATYQGNPDAYRSYGEFNLSTGRVDRAIEAFHRSLRILPHQPRAHRLLVTAYLRAGRPADALRAADEGIHLDGPSRDLLALRATALDRLGRRGEAVAAWRAVLHAAGGSWDAWLALGEALGRDGQAGEAAAALDSAHARAGRDTAALASIRRARASLSGAGAAQ